MQLRFARATRSLLLQREEPAGPGLAVARSISKNLPQKPGAHLSGVADEKVNHTGNTQVEESSEKRLHLKPATERKHPVRKKAVPKGDLRTCNSEIPEEVQERLDGCENIQEQAVERRQKVIQDQKHDEFLKEINHLKERLCQCEKEKAEKGVVIYIQHGLADTLKEPSLSKASQENLSHYHMKLEDEMQDLKKKLNQIRKQLEDEQSAHIEVLRNAEKMRERLQMLELENYRLKCKVNTQPGKTEQLQKNPLRANLARAAPQENLEQLRETNNASMRRQMELRIKDLESELNKMKIQENSTEVQLARYKQRYLGAVYAINGLLSKLSRAYDKLEVVQNKRLLDKLRHRTLLSTLSTRSVLQYPCGSNLDHSLAFQSRFLPQPSNNSVLSNLTKIETSAYYMVVFKLWSSCLSLPGHWKYSF